MNFGEKIRKLRAQRGMNQLTLAERAGISQTHLSQIEHGHIENPHLDTTRSLLEGLGVDPDRMFKHLLVKSEPDLFFEACQEALPAHLRN